MNLTTLKATCAAFHEVEPADLTKGSVDLFLVAANNARKKAEKKHDFEYAKCTASLDIDGVNGGVLSAATIAPVNTFSGIKQIIEVSGLRSGGDFVPLDFGSAEGSIERDRTELEQGTDNWLTTRYPSDAQFEAQFGNSSIVQRGATLYRFPRFNNPSDGALSVYMECYGWLNDYTKAQLAAATDTPQDFILEHGFEFLQWSIIIELNYRFKSFVPRQEGNLSSPERLQAEAWNDLLLWDSYLIAPNSSVPR